jgi:hypothetical protein
MGRQFEDGEDYTLRTRSLIVLQYEMGRGSRKHSRIETFQRNLFRRDRVEETLMCYIKYLSNIKFIM